MPETIPDEIPNYDDLSFEEAMGELESLVRGADSDRLPLNDMITGYEKGIRLHKVCQKRLDEARGRIELIRKRNSEEAELETFDASADSAQAPTQSKKQPTTTAASTGDGGDDEKTTFQDGELF